MRISDWSSDVCSSDLAWRRAQRAQPLGPDTANLVQRLLDSLPFALTPAQARVQREISADLERNFPMLRLLQGDVGSGKTVVAALAGAQAIAGGAQVAIMAPTEILARQHFQKLVAWLEPLGVSVAWLTGNQKTRARRQITEEIASGQAQLIVGTQAFIQDKIIFANLGLLILDEQHRFRSEEHTSDLQSLIR